MSPYLSDDEVLIFGKKSEPPTWVDALFEEHFEAFRWSSPVLGPILRETEDAHRRAFELLTMEVPQRLKAVRTLPYRDLQVAQFLIEEGAKVLSKFPEVAEERAALAEVIAAQSWPEARSKALEIRAEACRYQGEARVRLGDWQGAELAFGAALALLTELPVGHEHILFCKRLASLRENQGRLHEAAHLLRQAMRLYSQDSESVPPNDLVVHLAYVYLRLNDPGRAMTLLTQVSLRTKGPFAGWYQVDADLGRAMCLAFLGLAEPARRLLKESQPVRRGIADRDRILRLEWIACKVAVHLGDLKEAIPRLEAIRRWLLQRKDLADVCFCSIDLAFAYAKQGKGQQRLPELLTDIAKLPGAPEQPWALGSLWTFREVLQQRGDPAIAAHEGAEIVHRRTWSLRMRQASSIDAVQT